MCLVCYRGSKVSEESLRLAPFVPNSYHSLNACGCDCLRLRLRFHACFPDRPTRISLQLGRFGLWLHLGKEQEVNYILVIILLASQQKKKQEKDRDFTTVNGKLMRLYCESATLTRTNVLGS